MNAHDIRTHVQLQEHLFVTYDGIVRDPGEELLRPALELAFLVASVGSRRRPPVPAPPSLRSFLRFQKMPSAAMSAVFDAIEHQADFRDRVALAADEATVGPAGMLWLHRPQGWEDALTALPSLDGQPAGHEAPLANDRRMVALERSLREAKASLAVASAEAATATRRFAESEHARAKSERTRSGMEQEIAGLRRKLHRAETDRDRLTEQLRVATSTVAVAPVAAPSAAPAATPTAAAIRTAAAIPTPVAQIDLQGVSLGLAEAEAARDALDAAIARVRTSLAGPRTATSAALPTSAVVAKAHPTKSHRTRRHRARLPGGMLTESVDAARFLLARHDVIVLIDGYNVAKLAFPSALLREQREQLLDLTDELQARIGTVAIVMFDGADVGTVPSHRRRATVQFSPAGVTADDLIVSWLTAAPLDQVVVVVTSDKAVRDASDMLGAHLVHSAAFLAAAGRRI